MQYCPDNITLSDIWINHGVSVCFLQTVTCSIISSFALIFGITQLFFYRKYATRVDNTTRRLMFKLQIGSHVLLPMIAVADVSLKHLLASSNPIYGYEVLSLVSSLVTWPLCLVVLMVERHFQLPTPPSHGHGIVLLSIWSAYFVAENVAFLSMNNEDWWFDLSHWKNRMEFGFWVARYIVTFVVFLTGIKAPGVLAPHDLQGSWREPLLEEGADSERNRSQSASQGSTWRNFWSKMCTLMPYMWPKNSCSLQLRVLLCLLLLAGVRVTNVFVPLLAKEIVNKLSGHGDQPVIFAWDLIVGFVVLKMVQGGGQGSTGLLNIGRSFLWIRVQQFTHREIQLKLFQHLHSLSLRWHLSRKTGEVLRVMDRGTDSIDNLLNYLVFSIVPTFLDIIIAIIYFVTEFNFWFGVIVFLTMALYLACTFFITEWRTKFRRRKNEADNYQTMRAIDSLLNFETVKYFNSEQFEVDRYRQAILNCQDQEWKTLASLSLLNFCQGILINLGFLVGALYCGYLVSDGQKTVGDYVLFGTYIMQLMVPLNWLGTLYRVIQESFINMENMLDLLNQHPEVLDDQNAEPLDATSGLIEFKDVCFSYSPDRELLRNITFSVKCGQTVAIVGPTGSGKSTIIRLLFRFYDVQSGCIMIDGQDIRTVTQSSLREAIGVVPQDTVLFNDTIGANILYARPDAKNSEVKQAAMLSGIHDHIMSLKEGYDTMVGERGLKLSGGEKQRVAIARTLLKMPLVVLLDEATSALDTQTERYIQNALTNVGKNRTTVIVAHRLSTITHADCILVLKEGQIVQRGTHQDLLGYPDGLYAQMWMQQAKADAE